MTRLGIYSLLAGLFMGLFSGISSFMATQNFWVDLTLSKLIGENRSESIIGIIEIPVVQTLLDSVLYEVPFFCCLLGMGAVFLIVGLFVKEH